VAESCILHVIYTFATYPTGPITEEVRKEHTHTHSHNRFTALLEYVRTTRVTRYQKGKTRKVKTNLDLLEQVIVSGSGICGSGI